MYVRLKQGQTLDDIPKLVLMECAQLCKAGSIKGNKLDDITVIYTNFKNLRKGTVTTFLFLFGQFSFSSQSCKWRRARLDSSTRRLFEK